MTRHRGTLRIPDAAEETPAVFAVDTVQLKVIVADQEVAAWPATAIEVDLRPDGLHLTTPDDQIVVSVRDPVALTEELDEARRLVAGTTPRRSLPGAELLRRAADAIDPRWVIAALAVLGVLVVAVVATGALGRLLTLVGMLALVVAGLAMSEDLDVFRFMPNRLDEKTLVAGGFASVAIGLGLIFLS